MSEHQFKVGHKVTFTTTGRYPRQASGTVSAIIDHGKTRGGGIWADVQCSDGKSRRTRVGALRAA